MLRWELLFPCFLQLQRSPALWLCWTFMLTVEIMEQGSMARGLQPLSFQREILIKKKDGIFQRSFRFTAKVRGGYRDFSYTSATHIHSLPLLSTSPPKWDTWYHQLTCIDTSLSFKVHSLYQSSCLVLDILWVGANVYQRVSSPILSHRIFSRP